MKKYTVTIEETISEDFEVQANSAEQALGIAARKYKGGEFVLCPGELTYKQICVSSPESEITEWSEF